MNLCSNWPGSSFRMTLNRLSMNLKTGLLLIILMKVKMSTIALNNTLMSRMKIGPRF